MCQLSLFYYNKKLKKKFFHLKTHFLLIFAKIVFQTKLIPNKFCNYLNTQKIEFSKNFLAVQTDFVQVEVPILELI